MRNFVFVLLFNCIAVFAFGQRDTLIIHEKDSFNKDYEYTLFGNKLIFTTNKTEQDNITKNNSDTITITEKRAWIRKRLDTNCQHQEGLECFVYVIYPSIYIKNTNTKAIDKYVLLKENANNFKQRIPQIINQNDTIDLSRKKIFVDLEVSYANAAKIKATLLKRFGTLEKVYFFPYLTKDKELTNDWIYVINTEVEKIELLDIETSRVVETLEVER